MLDTNIRRDVVNTSVHCGTPDGVPVLGVVAAMGLGSQLKSGVWNSGVVLPDVVVGCCGTSWLGVGAWEEGAYSGESTWPTKADDDLPVNKSASTSLLLALEPRDGVVGDSLYGACQVLERRRKLGVALGACWYGEEPVALLGHVIVGYSEISTPS